MDLLTFKLLLAGTALALLVLILIGVRQLMKKRRPKAPAEGTPAEAPTRKRQLRPISELEEDLPPSPDAEESVAAIPEPAAGPMPAPEAEPEPEPEFVPEQDLNFSATVLARLEQAFERLQDGKITLAEYVLEVQGEQATVEAHLTALYTRDADPAVIDDAISAQDAVRWCLDWARDQGAP